MSRRRWKSHALSEGLCRYYGAGATTCAMEVFSLRRRFVSCQVLMRMETYLDSFTSKQALTSLCWDHRIMTPCATRKRGTPGVDTIILTISLRLRLMLFRFLALYRRDLGAPLITPQLFSRANRSWMSLLLQREGIPLPFASTSWNRVTPSRSGTVRLIAHA